MLVTDVEMQTRVTERHPLKEFRPVQVTDVGIARRITSPSTVSQEREGERERERERERARDGPPAPQEKICNGNVHAI